MPHLCPIFWGMGHSFLVLFCPCALGRRLPTGQAGEAGAYVRVLCRKRRAETLYLTDKIPPNFLNTIKGITSWTG